MRVPLAIALALPLLAGCLSGQGGDGPAPAPSLLTAAGIQVPDGASLQAIPGGFAAVWERAELPFSRTVTLPEHATVVRLVAESTAATGLSVVNAETGRRRCNTPTVDSFSEPYAAPKSCSGATALDAPGAEWTARVFGSGASPVRVEYLDTPLDGLLAGLDLSLVDPPTGGVQDTQVLFVPSWDGVRLRVEVTLPEGEGPWPTVIESNPYHDDFSRASPASYAYFAEDWARRGYAIVVADVRGFGDSGGCVEVWGPNEQKDQRFLVEWAAAQPWSDGNVGFYGQSYVGTTPVEAAVQAPEALKAIIAVAPVINAYEDWHYGGVPNGESRLSPVAYQVLTEGSVNMALGGGPDLSDPQVRDPLQLANNAANGYCDPTLVARANDPRSTYGPFYEERDFKRRAGQVTAAVLYTQGFEDANVKGAMIPGWFNELRSPKLGLFGHWLHQHPPRLDTEALMVAWMEQHLKGKPIGLDRLPAAAIQADRDTHRTADAWPPLDPAETVLWPDFAAGTLGAAPAGGSQAVRMDQGGATGGAGPLPPAQAVLAVTLDRDVSLAGTGLVRVAGAFDGVADGYLHAELHEVRGGESSLLTWGQLNLAHNADHTQYAPLAPGAAVSADLPLRPTERLLRAGTELRLVLQGATFADALDPGGAGSVRFTFAGGPDGTRLVLPGVDVAEYKPIPLTARP